MAIQFLPGGDWRFNLFADEFAYAMGAEFDLAKIELPKSDSIVLNLVCIDPSRGLVPNGTSYKRSAAEFWTSHNVDFAAFTSTDLETQIVAVRNGLIAAILQVPSSRLPEHVKDDLQRAAEIAAAKLASDPDRLPR